MSVEVMTAVFKRYPHGGGEMLLALALADHAHEDGTHVFPKIKGLAEKTRQSERSVQYQLRRMEEAGWLIRVSHGNGGRSSATEYRISHAWLKGADFASLKKSATDDEKGASEDGKGCNPAQKGCSRLHPQVTVMKPSMNHQESLTLTHRKFERPEPLHYQTTSHQTRPLSDLLLSWGLF